MIKVSLRTREFGKRSTGWIRLGAIDFSLEWKAFGMISRGTRDRKCWVRGGIVKGTVNLQNSEGEYRDKSGNNPRGKYKRDIITMQFGKT